MQVLAYAGVRSPWTTPFNTLNVTPAISPLLSVLPTDGECEMPPFALDAAFDLDGLSAGRAEVCSGKLAD